MLTQREDLMSWVLRVFLIAPELSLNFLLEVSYSRKLLAST